MNFTTLHEYAKAASGNETAKRKFKRAAANFLMSIADQLQLKPGSYDITFNAGGPAVSGEATLHHEAFYLQVGDFGAFWRTVKNRKDYTGGPNQWIISSMSEKSLTLLQLRDALTRQLVARNF
jgi:hypothetical protein